MYLREGGAFSYRRNDVLIQSIYNLYYCWAKKLEMGFDQVLTAIRGSLLTIKLILVVV